VGYFQYVLQAAAWSLGGLISAILLENVRGAAWCVTNILRNLKRKMWGSWHIISPLSEKVGDASSVSPPNCAHWWAYQC